MNRSFRTGFVLLLLALLSAAAVILFAGRTNAARRFDDLNDATTATIRRLGVAVRYDDQQRRQGVYSDKPMLVRAHRNGPH